MPWSVGFTPPSLSPAGVRMADEISGQGMRPRSHGPCGHHRSRGPPAGFHLCPRGAPLWLGCRMGFWCLAKVAEWPTSALCLRFDHPGRRLDKFGGPHVPRVLSGSVGKKGGFRPFQSRVLFLCINFRAQQHVRTAPGAV